MNTTYTVALKDGTTGALRSDSINDHPAQDFIGEVVRIRTKDENGATVEVEGELAEVLEAA